MLKKIDYDLKEVIMYKFICDDPTIISTYVGHTISFKDRKRKHKTSCSNKNSKEYNYLLYKTIRENGGWDNWKMFEIERVIVNNKQEALQREQYWIDLQVEKLNIANPVKKSESKITYGIIYREKNEKYFKNYNKIYRENNKEYFNNYYQKNKEKSALKYKQKCLQKKEITLMSKEDK